MPPSFSEQLHFASTHIYSPHGSSNLSRFSKKIVGLLKKEGFLPKPGDEGQSYIDVIEQSVATAIQNRSALQYLERALQASTLLVPVPGHAPMKNRESVWAARRICRILEKNRLGIVGEIVERITLVKKSATAEVGERPSPEEHYASISINKIPLQTFSSITLVDDVITRGSSFLGISQKIQELIPNIPIYCVALFRTMSGQEIETMIEPVEGVITYQNRILARRP